MLWTAGGLWLLFGLGIIAGAGIALFWAASDGKNWRTLMLILGLSAAAMAFCFILDSIGPAGGA